MVEWQWLVTVGLGSFFLGLIAGMIRIFCYHHKKTGKWMFEEANK